MIRPAFVVSLAFAAILFLTPLASPSEGTVSAQEFRKVESYLKRLFGYSAIRVVAKGADKADFYIATEKIGELTSDLNEGERSYNLRIEFQIAAPSVQPVQALTSYLRSRFHNDKMRASLRPNKVDTFEVYIDKEFLGAIFVDNENGRQSYRFNIPIFDVDIEDRPQPPARSKGKS